MSNYEAYPSLLESLVDLLEAAEAVNENMAELDPPPFKPGLIAKARAAVNLAISTSEDRPRFSLIDRCHEVGLTFPHGHEARLLLLDCRKRMLADAEEILKLRTRLRMVRVALDSDDLDKEHETS